jgi:predicted GIY-YIG superfamily endonuclease
MEAARAGRVRKEGRARQGKAGGQDMSGIASVKTTLYRHFNADGKLLYVGISLSALQRLSQHADHSDWYNKISRVEMEHFSDRPSAMAAEKKAVISEGPLYNIHHKKKPNKTRYQEYAEQSREFAGRHCCG